MEPYTIAILTILGVTSLLIILYVYCPFCHSRPWKKKRKPDPENEGGEQGKDATPMQTMKPAANAATTAAKDAAQPTGSGTGNNGGGGGGATQVPNAKAVEAGIQKPPQAACQKKTPADDGADTEADEASAPIRAKAPLRKDPGRSRRTVKISEEGYDGDYDDDPAYMGRARMGRRLRGGRGERESVGWEGDDDEEEEEVVWRISRPKRTWRW